MSEELDTPITATNPARGENQNFIHLDDYAFYHREPSEELKETTDNYCYHLEDTDYDMEDQVFDELEQNMIMVPKALFYDIHPDCKMYAWTDGDNYFLYDKKDPKKGKVIPFIIDQDKEEEAQFVIITDKPEGWEFGTRPLSKEKAEAYNNLGKTTVNTGGAPASINEAMGGVDYEGAKELIKEGLLCKTKIPIIQIHREEPGILCVTPFGNATVNFINEVERIREEIKFDAEESNYSFLFTAVAMCWDNKADSLKEGFEERREKEGEAEWAIFNEPLEMKRSYEEFWEKVQNKQKVIAQNEAKAARRAAAAEKNRKMTRNQRRNARKKHKKRVKASHKNDTMAKNTKPIEDGEEVSD